MNSRFQYNTAIINKLSDLIKLYPDLRFGQLLINAEIIQLDYDENNHIKVVDPFYEEPEVTWQRMVQNELCFSKNAVI